MSLVEPLEDAIAPLRRDADPVVAYGDAESVPGTADGHLDRAALGAEPDRVVQYVVEHLLHPQRIDPRVQRRRGRKPLRPLPPAAPRQTASPPPSSETAGGGDRDQIPPPLVTESSTPSPP